MSDYPIGLSIEEAVQKILEECVPVKTELVALFRANGRILAEDVIAKENIPPFERSPYDGYAFRSIDVKDATKENPVILNIIEEVPAGHVPSKQVQQMEAIKILTGAPIPLGADVVEKYENTSFTKKQVQIFSPLLAGTNVVPMGEDVLKGSCVMEKGVELTPSLIGLLGGLGYAKVLVYQKVSAALISTGDELVDVSQSLSGGKIRNSSIYALQAYLEQWGIETTRCKIVPDDVTKISEAVRQESKNVDVVITTGGVSVGDYDCLQRSMKQLHADILFWKVKMKPGSAFLASRYEKKLVLSLSGNPSAAAIALMMVGKPAFLRLSGRKKWNLLSCQVCLKERFSKKSPNRRLIPGKLVIEDGQAYLETASRQGNGMLSPLNGCDLLGEIPEGSECMEKGTKIKAYRI